MGLNVDEFGVVSWDTTSVPNKWILESTLGSGGPSSQGYTHSIVLAGDVVTFDAFSAGWPGGYQLILYGVDSNGNLTGDFFFGNNPTKNI